MKYNSFVVEQARFGGFTVSPFPNHFNTREIIFSCTTVAEALDFIKTNIGYDGLAKEGKN